MDNGTQERLEVAERCIAELQEAMALQKKRLEELQLYGRAVARGVAAATARFMATGDKHGTKLIRDAMEELIK